VYWCVYVYVYVCVLFVFFIHVCACDQSGNTVQQRNSQNAKKKSQNAAYFDGAGILTLVGSIKL